MQNVIAQMVENNHTPGRKVLVRDTKNFGTLMADRGAKMQFMVPATAAEVKAYMAEAYPEIEVIAKSR